MTSTKVSTSRILSTAAERDGLVAVKAFYQLLELQGIKLGFEDSSALEKQCRDKPGSQNIRYKEALQMIQPDYELPDPIRGTWVTRGKASDAGSRMGASRMSRASRASLGSSVSPKKQIPPDFHQRHPHPIAVPKTIPKRDRSEDNGESRQDLGMKHSQSNPHLYTRQPSSESLGASAKKPDGGQNLEMQPNLPRLSPPRRPDPHKVALKPNDRELGASIAEEEVRQAMLASKDQDLYGPVSPGGATSPFNRQGARVLNR